MNKESRVRRFRCLLLLLTIMGAQTLLTNMAYGQGEYISNPTSYTPLGNTTHLSGSVADIQFDDTSSMVFGSYHTTVDAEKHVSTDQSDVDSSSDKGTHGNFSAQQSGPDLAYDTLTEEKMISSTWNLTLINGESFEGSWPPPGWNETDAWNMESDQAHSGSYSADFDGSLLTSSGNLDSPMLNCSDAHAIYVSFWYRDDNCDIDDFLLEYHNGSIWRTRADLGATTQEDQWLNYQDKITDSQYLLSTFRIRWSAVSAGSGEHLYVDSINVTKETGTSSYQLDLEVQWTNLNYHEENGELTIYANKKNNTGSLNLSGGYMIVGDGITEDWGSNSGTISFWITWTVAGDRPWGQHENMETRLSGSNLVLDWGSANALTSNTSFTSSMWYFIAIVWNENTDELRLYVGDQANAPTLDAYNSMWTSTVSTVGVAENNFMASKGGVDPTEGLGEELRYWNIARNSTELQRDYHTELTGSEPNLASYFKLNGNFDNIGRGGIGGSGSGSYSFSSDVPFDSAPTEKIRVDAWDNGSWQTLLPDLDIGWNNVSVSSYLDSATFTIRFKGEMEAADVDQDVWRVDTTLLDVWSDVHLVEVEFSGHSNETLSALTWTIISSWTTDVVDVTIRFHNYSSSSFATSGPGFFRYASSPLPLEDEIKNQTITNPTGFGNATGHWRMMITGAKGDSPFELKINQVTHLASHGALPTVFDWKPAFFSALLLLGVLLPLTMKLKRRGKSDGQISTLDPSDESFSASHPQVMRGKTLLIMDSTPGFYSALVDFIRKSIANGESLFIFTSRNSLLHTAFSGESARFYLLSPKISSLKTPSKREILVPMRDLSGLLDVMSRIWRKGIRKPRTIIFDNLSDTILMCGFEKTYKFMRFLLEAKSSPRAKALFVFNPTAHDPAVSSSVRGLFQFQSADFGTKTES